MPRLLLAATLLVLAASCSGGEEPAASIGAGTVPDPAEESATGPADDGADQADGIDAGSTEADPDADQGDTVTTAGSDDTVDEESTDPQSRVEAEIDQLEGDALEEFVARRYEAFWLAFGEAREQPDAEPATAFPRLADLAAGQQLDAAYAELADMAETGRALREPDEPAVPGLDNERAHRIRIERIDAASAELVTCFVNDRRSIQVSDGAVISDLVVTVKAESTMVRTDGTWKLVRSQAVALDPGVGGCWLEDESLYPW